jgi:amino acid adenylation domain-containing protein
VDEPGRLLKGLAPEKRAELERLLLRHAAASGEAAPIPRRTGDEPCALSFAQERLWFVCQLSPGLPLYNQSLAVVLDGPVDVAAMERALGAVVARHEAVRTTFALRAGVPVQNVRPACDVPLHVVDLGPSSDGARFSQLRARAAGELLAPFDLAHDLLLRAVLFRVRPDEHVLLLLTHHIASDGWSKQILLGDLAALYDAFAAGRKPALVELPIRFADFAVWQRAALSGTAVAPMLDYWRRRLADLPPALDLPLDHARGARNGFHGAVARLAVGEPLAAAIEELARREDATLYMVLLAGFQVLLSRYSGQSDVVVGSPVAGRRRRETAGMIGCFINNLVMRCDLSERPSFREVLRRVRRDALDAFAHQDLPFERLVQELKPARDLQATPLFQVVLQVRNLPRLVPPGHPMGWRELNLETEVMDIDLSCEGRREAGEMTLALKAKTELFDVPSIRRMLGHLRELLASAVADPERPVTALSLLTEAERRAVAAPGRLLAAADFGELAVHHRYERMAARDPDAVAVAGETQSLTYGHLDARADRLAAHLMALGAGPGTTAAIVLERSPALLVAVLAVLKTGAAFMLIEADTPVERLGFLLADAHAGLVVTDSALAARVPATAARAVVLDDIERTAPAAARARRGDATGPDDVAYLTYTSGSTGRPKGVPCRHAGVINYLSYLTATYDLRPEDAVLSLAPVSFDALVRELFAPLWVGARVILLPESDRRDPRALLAAMRSRGATCLLGLVPTMLRELAAVPAAGDPAIESLRLVLFTGEPLTWADVDEARRIFGPRVRLVNQYGPTETTMTCSYAELAGMARVGAAVPIGRAIPNMRLTVVDEALAPVPVGVVGEILIGGIGVSRGYLDRPALTAERFLPDPGAADENARRFRTGDLGRMGADGTLAFLGRSDRQVKIRGCRIELAEVESALRAHPGVRQALVEPWASEGGDRLVGYVVPTPGQAPTDAELRRHLEGVLPDYMRPAAFVLLLSLPLTASGKVDRRALPQPGPARSGQDAPHVAPRDDLERVLAAVWEELLGVRPIGIEDDFFALGGHSLLAVRLFARMEIVTGRRLPLALIFAAPTVASLAVLLRRDRWSPPRSPLVPIRTGGSCPPLFLIRTAGGHVLPYGRLATLLDAEQPVYGLQQADEVTQPATGVVEMATRFVAEIRSVQPRGPYHLGGLSFGGLLAFEVAQQLSAAGEDVALLALLDTRGPGCDGTRFGLRERVFDGVQRVEYHIGNLSVLSGSERVRYLVRSLTAWSRRFAGYAHGMFLRLRGAARPEVPVAIRREQAIARWARERYVPRPYCGHIDLFRAREQWWGIRDPWLGWGGMAAGGITAHEVPGHHVSIIAEPHVRVLAEKLSECLRRVHGGRLAAGDGAS